MDKKYLLIAIIVAGLAGIFFLGCNNPINASTQSETAGTSDLAETQSQETFSEGPVLLFDQPSSRESGIIHLDFYSKPLPLGSRRNLKLSGIVLGKEPLAVLEVAGMGRSVSVGMMVEGYRIESIRAGEICLKKTVPLNLAPAENSLEGSGKGQNDV